jgi:hypothetical protein
MDATLAMMAAAQSDADARLAGLASRCPGLVRRLKKFSFVKLVHAVAGLLTLPENHPANARLAALVHLAALFCEGDRVPTLANVRDWVNDILLKDAIGQREDPVEDVCISNVVTWFGNVRLFDGGWQDNDYSLQGVLAALVLLRGEPWTGPVARSVQALLKMSEAIAERASLPRFTLSPTGPRQPIRISQNTVEASSAHIEFTVDELGAMSIGQADLQPFEFLPNFRPALENETLGHTSLERHPILTSEGKVFLALPTAVSAAVRRYVMESAAPGQTDAFPI